MKEKYLKFKQFKKAIAIGVVGILSCEQVNCNNAYQRTERND